MTMLVKEDRSAMILADIKKKMAKASGAIAERMKDDILKSFSAISPSQPGEPPAGATGKLGKSLRVEVSGAEAKVVVDADPGLFLEFGTTNMEPRPFIRPAGMRAEGYAQEEAARALKGY